MRRLKRSKIRVVLGDHDQFVTTETEAIQRAVSAIIRHRNFDQNTYNHDIALLRLRKPVLFAKGIQPICLPRESIDPSGKIGTVVGWGRTSEGGSLPGILQHVSVPVLTLDQCRGMKYRASRITPNMVNKNIKILYPSHKYFFLRILIKALRGWNQAENRFVSGKLI